MKPKRIILIRHGESEGNVDRRVYGQKPDYTLLLTAKGIEQARSVGKNLKALVQDERIFFYVSPLWRTRMTFEEIIKAFSPAQFHFNEEPRLREQEWGHLRNLEECAKTDRERDAFGTFYYRIEDGESGADVYDRVSDFFSSLYRDFQKSDYPENAVIITHGMTIRIFLMRWFHWTVEEFETYSNPQNGQMVILEKQPNERYCLMTELKRKAPPHPYQRPIRLPD
ncbi:MAG: histidine phosphatase family protein [Chlorobiales bacterium]